MFKHQIRVAYRDVTVGNHIYYSRYLDLLEIVRSEIFRDLGFSLVSLQDQNVIFPVIECSLKYHVPARYDDLLEIESVFSNLGKVQFTLDYQIKRSGTLLTSASTRHAVTNLEEKPIRMPSELFTKISVLVGKKEET
jgi:acyl-CoA thioester hydrolase